jgi:formylglycine-generating enzyme required for sulfatase activity
MVRVPAAGYGGPEFFISRTEVTWDMFDVYMLRLDTSKPNAGADAIARPSEPYGAPDYGWGHAGYPAMSVTQASAIAFCQWLSAKTGRTYRLPTDAEWSRAASPAAYSGESPRVADIAWHQANSGGQVHPVAKKPADGLGLFDLFGNVGEWVTSPDGSLVIRGGSYRDPLKGIGPEARAVQEPTWNQRDPQLPKSRWWLSDGPFVGFRVLSPVSNPSER